MIDGASSPVVTPLAEPIFLMQAEKIAPARMERGIAQTRDRRVCPRGAKNRALGQARLSLAMWYSVFVPKRDLEKTRSTTSRMALASEAKQQILSTNQRHKSDTGSPEVQIALLSQRLTLLLEHFAAHKKDNGSRKGLLTLVAKRRRLVTYLRKTDPELYKAVLQRLGIRR